MRSSKVTLWAVALLALAHLTTPRRAEAQTQIKPYIMILLDTSSSMLYTPCSSGEGCYWETLGDGSDSFTRTGWGNCCPGRDMGTGTPPSAWDMDTDPDDSRLWIAKKAISDVVSAYGDVTFGLMRYYAQECAAPFMCYGDSASEVIFPAYMDNMNTGWGEVFNPGDYFGDSPPFINEYMELDLISYQGFASRVDCTWPLYSDCRCEPLFADGGDVLVGFYEDNANDIVEWIDGVETFNGTPGPGGTATAILNHEIRATGFTPLGRAIDAANDYMVPIRNADSLRDCRSHILVIITDGEDTCWGDPVTSVDTLYGNGIESYTIGFAFASATLDDMADRGDDGNLNGSRSSFNASNEDELSAAFQSIIEDTVLVEICDGGDDDCDTLIDEGFTKYCDIHDVLGLGATSSLIRCEDPGETQCDGLDDNCDGSVDEGLLNDCGTCGTLTEVCDGVDNDCDGLTDEGGVCGTCVPSGEVCDGADNDCDTIADEALTRPCGTDVGDCVSGTQTCTSGTWGTCVGEVPPEAETCNGEDDDCDGVVDGFSEPCDLSPGVGDTGVCEYGYRICTAAAWGSCQGGVGPSTEVCDGLDNDCDGSTDEGNPGGGTVCGTDTGECVAGTTLCTGGSLVCDGETPPAAEVCDGLDNDCDGVADDGNPGGGAVCGPTALDGIGICQTGVETCTGGVVQCVGAVWPATEICNGLDDDCNGTADDGNPGGGAVCGTDTGECVAGVTNCSDGVLVCQGEVGSTTEICNGLDDDCDGTADDGNPGGGAVCGTDTGECVAGVVTCMSGSLTCFGEVSSSPEVCDGADNDCDGTADEGNPEGGAACGPVTYDGIGICEAGIMTCTGGSLSCEGAVDPTLEVCNGLDDDCNGTADDGDPGGGGPCGTDTGECETGTYHCVGGTLACEGEVGPDFDVCDGLDNDCDGTVDNGNPGGGAVCGTDVGECQTGTLACIGGSLVCDGETAPEAELCDGLDNDCDGDLDEGNPEGGASCGPVSLDGIGICQAGVTQCVTSGPGSALLDCVGAVEPTTEVCNGLDDDCNGTADDGDPGGGASCGTDTGECVAGTEHCVGGAIVCEGAVGPATEICDGLDNDCDGSVDEADPGGGASCGTDTGECISGTVHCIGGALVCDGGILATAELCNGLDDDCDGTVDDGNPEGGTLCGPVALDGIGICQAGVQTCVTTGPGAATLECLGAVYPEAVEDCNGLDDDCNGSVDDGIATGDDCGTDVGECSMGHRECVTGVWVCVGEVGPEDELCDGLDNNCDGVSDEGNPEGGVVCGTDVGECEPGITYCDTTLSPPDIICMGEVGPVDEVCDGLDNDCNHLVDDGLPVGDTCGTDEGECETGNYICLDGEIVCAYGVGPTAEVCDGLDNDCDGVADNEAECPGESICVEGYCASPCDPDEEWPCPSGTICEEVEGEGTYCVGDPCEDVVCEEDERCRGGECVSICDMVECPPGQVCIIEDGAPQCIPADCYAEGWECDEGERCVAGECEPDPCWDVVCGEGQFCREGECFDSCGEDVVCADDERCVDGECVDDLCHGVECSFGLVCNPDTGLCEDDLCGGVSCREPLICVDGECVDDPCSYIVCPEGHVCIDGSCYDEDTVVVEPEPDASTDADTDADGPVQIAATGAGGCVGCTMSGAGNRGGDAGGLLVAVLMGALALGLAVRRRLRPGLTAALLAAAALAVSACDTTPYCLDNCDEVDGSADTETDVEADGETDAVTDTVLPDTSTDTTYDVPETCNPMAEELCNGVDDDCDGDVDEGFDLTSDPNNCGECGRRCELPHAYVSCVESECVIDPERGCDVNFYDCVDDDPAESETMGCETYCIRTRDDDAHCDGYDNDCDCVIDEDVDLTTDVDNCGACGRRCRYFNAIPGCESDTGLPEDAECFLADCLVGFHDEDEDPDTGCEYECNQCERTEGACETGLTCCTEAGAETCNGMDDNCDGVIDEGDPGGGEACGSDVGQCTLGTSRCADGTLICEGDTRPVQETCNGLDDDCDGDIDEPDEGETRLPDEGVACGESMGDCERGLTVCVDGVLDCQGGVEPVPEICDGHDNDCNGDIDDGDIVGLGDPCGSDTGQCVAGTMTCVAGTPVCVGEVEPVEEVCDGLDNDCDGTADEDIPGAGAVCGSDTGQCVTGTMQCESGSWVCAGETPPASELCDGLDNDCDGLTDEGDPGSGASCGTSVGACEAGTMHCVSGSLVCQGDVGPTMEVCNGLDDDCNGTADDGTIPGMGDLCGSDTGECVAGVLQCVGGVETCVGETDPVTETCNGLDDDCDGTVDDAVPGVGTVCGFDTGQCVTGTMQCVSGSLVCQGAVGPTAEVCNDLDDDCDGTVDDGDPGGGASCESGTGECVAGTEHCVGGSIVCQGAVGPTTEVCDGLDNDCDGTVDDGDPGGGASCGTDVGECVAGTEHCVGGSIQCVGSVEPVSETCDTLDNDCDGIVDNATPGAGSACGTATGECVEGSLECVSGSMECVGDVGPSFEVCNDLDDDCDGTVDDGNPGGGASCGSDTGECSAGVEFCVGGSIVCQGDVGPTAEVCDWLDNDCDGTADDGDPGGGATCGSDTGECSAGTEHCVGGAVICQGDVGPTAEVCDGLDNDCDGTADEDFLLDIDPTNCGSCGHDCATEVSAHAVYTCSSGSCVVVGCDLNWWPGPDQGCTSGSSCCTTYCEYTGEEVCDGVDNDCDGDVDTADSSLVGVSNYCQTAGACAGAFPECTTKCGSTAWYCNYSADVSLSSDCVTIDPESGDCDDIDNDCDGLTDEHFPLKGSSCSDGIGECRDTGSYVCTSDDTGIECNASATGGSAEACNGLDDDCNGVVDDFASNAWSVIGAQYVNGQYIFTHEASRPDAASCDPGTETYDGAGTLTSRACSHTGAQPWTNISYDDARQACLNLGGSWDLCTAAEWQDICETSGNWSYPYGNTYQQNACNGNDFDTDCPCGGTCDPSGDNDEILDTGSMGSCVSDWGGLGIMDMSGNVKEWTRTSHLVDTDGDTTADTTYYEIRGGASNNSQLGLTCQFDFALGRNTFTFFNLGFRCCHP